MNRLEQYIRDNKSRFDEEPAAGHFERWQQKTDRKPGRIVALRWSVSIAASIAILLSAGIIRQYAGKQAHMMAMCENAHDMKVCYLNRMNVVADRIEELTRDLDQWDQQQVMTDVHNIIDAAGSGFENEIPEELPDEKTRSILSDYYRQNLESLEMIREKVEQ
ncbi:MAG: hypothetical protein LBL24_04290 [Bacteroidales bacterium]|nr:hypothetical protein [Bacteroidales bacterium]